MGGEDGFISGSFGRADMKVLVARQFEQLFELQLILSYLGRGVDHVILATAHLGFELRHIALRHLPSRQQLAATGQKLTVGVEELAVRGFGLAAVQYLHIKFGNLLLDGVGLLPRADSSAICWL